MGGVFNFTQLESRRSDYQLDGRILVTEIRQEIFTRYGNVHDHVSATLCFIWRFHDE